MSEQEVTRFRPSPFVVGDYVSLRKWIDGGVNRERLPPFGRVSKIWRSSNASSGIKVRVSAGFLKWVDLDSEWLTLI